MYTPMWESRGGKSTRAIVILTKRLVIWTKQERIHEFILV